MPRRAIGYRCGEFTPEDAARAALDAIRVHDGEVNAFVLVDEQAALAQASASTRRWQAGNPIGPADGVPASIKDMLLTRGWPTLRGSTLVAQSQSWDVDAPAVARLRESGAVLLGKNTTPEFAWKGVTDSIRHGATGNPWGAGLTSGGSSGGAATAVGLGMGTWSVGTDGGGSMRIPASFTGTVALKPTFGRIPIHPPSPYGTLSHAGPMTRTVTDAALLLDLIARPDSRTGRPCTRPRCPTSRGLDDGVVGLSIALSPRPVSATPRRLCHIATALLTRIAACWRNGTPYQLRDLDGRPHLSRASTADHRRALHRSRRTTPHPLHPDSDGPAK